MTSRYEIVWSRLRFCSLTLLHISLWNHGISLMLSMMMMIWPSFYCYFLDDKSMNSVRFLVSLTWFLFYLFFPPNIFGILLFHNFNSSDFSYCWIERQQRLVLQAFVLFDCSSSSHVTSFISQILSHQSQQLFLLTIFSFSLLSPQPYSQKIPQDSSQLSLCYFSLLWKLFS